MANLGGGPDGPTAQSVLPEMSGAGRVYWDAAQVAPLHPAAVQAFSAALSDGWADPRRLHAEGRRAALVLEGAREAVADALGLRPEGVAFTGSFAAAAHAGVLGTLAAGRRRGDLLVHSAVEHSAVLAAAAAHTAAGGRAATVAVDGRGRVDPQAAVAAVWGEGVAAAAVQLANGEVGTRQPVEQVQEGCARAQVPLVMDVSAALGHVPLPPGVGQVLMADPQAWGGVPGLGVLAVRPGTRWRSVQPEDDAVPADRPGVPGRVSVPAALAAAVSLQQVLGDREADRRRREAVDLLRRRLPELVPDLQVVGHPTERLPHVLTFSALFVDGEALLLELDRAGFAVGSGSACTAATVRPSHVLAAMDVLTQGNVRVGLPVTASAAELHAQVERFLQIVGPAVGRVRAHLGVGDL